MSDAWTFLRTHIIPLVGLIGIAIAIIGAMQATEQAEQAKLTANDAATAAQNASDAAQSGKTAASRATDAADASKDAAVNSLEAVQGIGELIKMVRSLLTGGTFERPSSPTEQAIVEDLIAAKVITCEAVMCTVSKERSIIEMAITSEITAIDGAAAVGKVIQQLELLPELQTAAITTNKRLQALEATANDTIKQLQVFEGVEIIRLP